MGKQELKKLPGKWRKLWNIKKIKSRKNKFTKSLAYLLAFCLTVTGMPVFPFGGGTAKADEAGQEFTATDEDGNSCGPRQFCLRFAGWNSV